MPDLDPTTLTIAGLAPRIAAREVSPVELTACYLERIKRLNPTLNAYSTVMEEDAIADARRAENEDRPREPSWPAPRHARLHQGQPRGQGLSHDRRQQDPGGLEARLRRHRGHPAQGGRSHRPGQEQHARVGRRRHDHKPLLRHHPQPVGPEPGARRLQRRLGRRSGRGSVPDLHRHRQRRLCAEPRRLVRHRGPQGHLRPREPLRRHCRHRRLLLRPLRPLHQDRGGLRAGAGRNRRGGSQRPTQLSRARARLHGKPGRLRRRHEGRRRQQLLRRAYGGRGRQVIPGRPRRAGIPENAGPGQSLSPTWMPSLPSRPPPAGAKTWWPTSPTSARSHGTTAANCWHRNIASLTVPASSLRHLATRPPRHLPRVRGSLRRTSRSSSPLPSASPPPPSRNANRASPKSTAATSSPPKAAADIETGTRQNRLVPSRWKSACSVTSMKI